MNKIYTMVKRSKNTVAIFEATKSQTIGLVSVDGEIVGEPSVNGTTGIVRVKKDTGNKMYIYNLPKASLVAVNFV